MSVSPAAAPAAITLAIKVDKKSQGEPKNIIMGAFGGHYDIKQVVVVDMDVNIDDETEIEWAVATRFQADRGPCRRFGARKARSSIRRPITASAPRWGSTPPSLSRPMRWSSKRIHVKDVEKVDLGKALQTDPRAAFARIVAG